MKTSVIISHSGKQHSYHVAKTLFELGYLKRFYTSSYLSNIFLQELSEKLNFNMLSRRYLKGLGGGHVNANWRYEVRELLMRKLKGNTKEVNDLVFRRDIRFDADIARRLTRQRFDIFWGFQGSCFRSLQSAKSTGAKTVCEMTIAHLPYANRLLTEEASLQPEWAESIDFTSLPPEYSDRLIQEPILADKVVAISSFLKKTLVEEGVSSKKIEVIPLGFDANAITYEAASKSFTGRPLKLLYAGKITQRKGISYLLEAIKKFPKSSVELHIIGNVHGDGKTFRKHAHLYEYQKGVTQSELFKLYSNYDALVFPSVLEGFGLVTVEAMGAGLPVITTPNTNAAELISDGVNGYVVPIRDSNAIAEAIHKLRSLTDHEFQQMRENARQSALQYTWDNYKERLNAFVQTLTR